jgi:hypothetical protein
MKPKTDVAGRQVAVSRESQDDYNAFCSLKTRKIKQDNATVAVIRNPSTVT